MTILVPLGVALVGVVVYALASNPKIAEMGRIAFGCGLFVTLVEVGGRHLSFLAP